MLRYHLQCFVYTTQSEEQKEGEQPAEVAEMMAAEAEDGLPEISWSHDVSWHESHGLMRSYVIHGPPNQRHVYMNPMVS